MEDFELLRSWRDGDRAAGNALVRRHFGQVYGFFRNKAGAAADDLAQRTFLGCVEALAHYRGEASFRGYLFGIARKQLLRFFAEQARDRKLIDFTEVSLEQLASSPSGAVVAQQEGALLAAALRRVPLELQLTVELYYAQELPVADVAAALEVPAGTVRSRLTRARALLKEEIERLGAQPALAQTTIDNLRQLVRECIA